MKFSSEAKCCLLTRRGLKNRYCHVVMVDKGHRLAIACPLSMSHARDMGPPSALL